MDQRLSSGYKILIAVLVVALLIAVWGWVQASKADSLGDVYQGVAAFRAEIDTACRDTSTPAGRAECEEKLSDFREALVDYQEVVDDLEEDSTTGTATSS